LFTNKLKEEEMKKVLMALAATIALSGCLPEEELQTYTFKKETRLSLCISSEMLEALVQAVVNRQYFSAVQAPDNFHSNGSCPYSRGLDSITAVPLHTEVVNGNAFVWLRIGSADEGVKDYYALIINRTGPHPRGWEDYFDVALAGRTERGLWDFLGEVLKN